MAIEPVCLIAGPLSGWIHQESEMLAHSLHPALTDVPLGAWTAGLMFDLFGRADAADAAYGLGSLAAVPTALTGAAYSVRSSLLWSSTDRLRARGNAVLTTPRLPSSTRVRCATVLNPGPPE